MKKNLRIVSAAAAALLAVAPVAASAVSTVSADTLSTTASSTTTGIQFQGAATPTFTVANNDDVNVGITVSAVGATTIGSTNVDSSVSASATATYKGTSYSINVPAGQKSYIYAVNDYTTTVDGNSVSVKAGSSVPANQLVAGQEYYAVINNATLNFGSQNANKKITLTSSTDTFKTTDSAPYTKSVTVTLDKNGVTPELSVKTGNFTAVDVQNGKSVSFYELATGNQVTTGSLTVNAGSESKLNVYSILAAFNQKYQAAQLNNVNGNANKNLISTTTTAQDIASQLRAQNITVGSDGYFTAPKSFTLNFTAKSSLNNASATLPVTISVPNGVTTTPAAVPTTGNVTIMHAAYTYELKDGKLTRVSSADTLHAYSSIPVYGTTTVNGKKYYRVSATENWYINAGNVDGTSRTLGHNAYVYNNKGKRVKSEGTWKKGTKHTTYGAAMNIKGSRMYRVDRNRYVKVVNFD